MMRLRCAVFRQHGFYHAAQPCDFVRQHPFPNSAASLPGGRSHSEVTSSDPFVRHSRYINSGGFDCPKQRSLDLVSMVTSGSGLIKARLVRFEIRQSDNSHCEMWLQERNKRFEIHPVWSVMSGQQNCNVEP